MKDTLKLVLFLWLFGMLSAASLYGQSGNDCFGLNLSSHNAEPGDTVCVDVSVRGFTEMQGMQYTLKWEPAALQFIKVDNFNLPGLNSVSFGNFTSGRLTTVWVDPSLQGETLPDETVIYSVCFQVVAQGAGSAKLWFSDTPTTFEFVSMPDIGNLTVIPDFVLGGSNILIGSGTPSPLSIESACVQAGSCMTGGAFEATLSNGTAPYDWSFGGSNNGSTQTSEINASLSPGLYELTITDADGQEILAAVSVGGSSLDVTGVTIVPVVCNGGNGSITINSVSGASGSLSYLWSTGATTAGISVSSAGTYDVTISDEGGCSLQRSFTVPGSSAFSLSADIGHPACANQADGSINLSVSPLGDYTYNWSNGANTQDIANLDAGTYSVTVTETQSGCTQVDSYILNPTGLGILFSFMNCNAPNDTLTIITAATAGQPPFSYLWSTGETTASIDVPAVQGTVYSVTITDANGCSDIGFQAVNCLNGQATLSITGGTVAPSQAFCLDVNISNTVPVGGMAIQLDWDSNILQFDAVTNLQVSNPGLAIWNNDEPGVLEFLWADTNMPFPVHAQPSQLMEVCFTALQAGSTAIDFSANASETYLFDGSGAQNLALFTTGNTVYVNGGNQQEIGIRVISKQVNELDPVCMEVKASNFEELTQLAYDMTWDAAELEFTGIQNINPAALLTIDAFTIAPTGDSIHLDWEAGAGASMNLANDATIYEVCFSAIGAIGTHAVEFSNEEAQRAGDLDLFVESIDGNVLIQASSASQYAELSLAPGAVIDAGQSACLPVSVGKFEGLFGFQGTIAWDPTLVRFDSFQTADLPSLSSTNFGLNHLNQGKITMAWIDPQLMTGVTLMEGATAFNLCFSAIGPSGVSTLTFESTPTLVEFNTLTEIIPHIVQGGFIIVSDQNVWPGDTDHNGHVNHFDLLPIGLAFNANGPLRPDATIDWMAQAAPSWAQNTPTSGVNFKHIDSNGDGTILVSDTLAVSQNWGLSVNPFQTEPTSESRVLGVPLYVLADTLSSGEVAILDIILGTTEQLAEDVYGLAFSITYNPEYIVPGSASASFEESWLGQQGSDLLSMYRVASTQDRIDIALTRTDGLNNSGNGAIGKLHITIEDVIFRNVFRRAEFGIENVRLISRDEIEIPVAPETTISWISTTTTGTHDTELANSIRLYPSPASEYISIATEGAQVNAVQILDQYGRNVANFENLTERINVSNLAAGVYVARIQTDRGIAHKTFLIAH